MAFSTGLAARAATTARRKSACPGRRRATRARMTAVPIPSITGVAPSALISRATSPAPVSGMLCTRRARVTSQAGTPSPCATNDRTDAQSRRRNRSPARGVAIIHLPRSRIPVRVPRCAVAPTCVVLTSKCSFLEVGTDAPRRSVSAVEVHPCASFDPARRGLCRSRADGRILLSSPPETQVEGGDDEEVEQCRGDQPSEDDHRHGVLDLVSGDATLDDQGH